MSAGQALRVCFAITMEKNTYLKTVLYGGYDQDGVRIYLQAMNTKIALLEKDLSAAKAVIAESGKEEALAEAIQSPLSRENEALRRKAAELDQLRMASESRADELQMKNDKLTAENDLLSKQLADTQARLAASSVKNKEEALQRVLAVGKTRLEEMKARSESEIAQMRKSAEATATRIIADANARAAVIASSSQQNRNSGSGVVVDAAKQVELSTINDLHKLAEQVRKIKDCLEAFTATGIAQIEQTNTLISNAEKMVAKGEVPAAWQAQLQAAMKPTKAASPVKPPVPTLSAPQAMTPPPTMQQQAAPKPQGAEGAPATGGPSLASIVEMAEQLSQHTEQEKKEKNENGINLDDIAKLAASLDYPPEATDMKQKMDLEELANIAESL